MTGGRASFFNYERIDKDHRSAIPLYLKANFKKHIRSWTELLAILHITVLKVPQTRLESGGRVDLPVGFPRTIWWSLSRDRWRARRACARWKSIGPRRSRPWTGWSCRRDRGSPRACRCRVRRARTRWSGGRRVGLYSYLWHRFDE